MAKIFLEVPIEITVVGGKKGEVVKVSFKELSKADAKENRENYKKWQKLSRKINRLNVKAESANRKVLFYDKVNKTKEAIAEQDKLDTIFEDIEKVQEEMDVLGGEDFLEQRSKNTFEKTVKGKDKERLVELAEQKGYFYIMEVLNKAKAEAEGKLQEESQND